MDLTKTVPRSPYETLGGIMFLPRAIDKMRAHLAGTKGGYDSHDGTSERMFRYLFGISAEQFEQIVRDNATDDGVLDALLAIAPLTPELIELHNEAGVNDGPIGEAEWQQHWQRLEASGHGHRREIVTRYDRLDLDEGRDVPAGGRRVQFWARRRAAIAARLRAAHQPAAAQGVSRESAPHSTPLALGSSTLHVAHTEPFTPLLLDQLRELGVAAIEIADYHANFSYEDQAWLDRARGWMDERGLALHSIHAHFERRVPGSDLASPDETVRRDSLAVYRNGLAALRRLGGSILVTHHIAIPSPDSQPEAHAARRRAFAASLRELAGVA